jgi:malic enzyme
MQDYNNTHNPESEALELHATYPAGKIQISLQKDISNKLDLAYSPHVAAPCLKINEDPNNARLYTNKKNAVTIITNGSAVLGLGNIGALASIPVMEGKSALFKMLAGIDCFVNVIDEQDATKFADIVKSIISPYSAVNLEDIAAPSCFAICEYLHNVSIPIFHDDQHGTAIVISAGLRNYLRLANLKINDIKIVCLGAGAAAIATLNMLVLLGADKEKIYVFDSKGLIYMNRDDINDPKNKYKKSFAQKENISFASAMENTNVLLGLSAGGKIDSAVCNKMANFPLIMALQNPNPEIMPDELQIEAVYCSGRSDLENQINNVLCFPYLFRVVLDFDLKIDDKLMIAVVNSIADIGVESKNYQKSQILPQPFDPVVKYTMPSKIVSHMNLLIQQEIHRYSREIAGRVNPAIREIILKAQTYLNIEHNYQHALQKIADYCGLNQSKHCFALNDHHQHGENVISFHKEKNLFYCMISVHNADIHRILSQYLPVIIGQHNKPVTIGQHNNCLCTIDVQTLSAHFAPNLTFDDFFIINLIIGKVLDA